MKVIASKSLFARLGMLVVLAMSAAVFAPASLAADDGSSASVECMLPGQIRSIDGHATMGPRHPEHLAAAECRQRGGEYTEVEQSSRPVAVRHVPLVEPADNRIVTCLLPRQPRRVGEEARYQTAARTVRITASDCSDRSGSILAARRIHRPIHKK